MSSLAAQEEKLASRRRALVAACEGQRAEMVLRSQELQGLLHAVDTGVGIFNRLRQHPGLVLGATAIVLAIVRPRRMLAGVNGLMAGLRAMNAMGPMLSSIRSRRAQ